ncbi:serine/threonine-protein kinase [Lentzea sp. JNUCC 0626]|uniref:serine/threonine-protein kinase n=1 Tax=Lentzea sp. JNUCC 0626 TaxID=3367513 RepID=UPI003748402F
MEESSRLIGSRYQLKQKVGQGAMGVVWQAYDEQLHRVVAAKELLALDGLDDARVDRAKARAMREARLAARLEHPNAIRVYDVVEEDGRPWLIMEYLPSRSLAAVITEQGTLPPREVARIGCYTAAALAAAHRHGIQHRDVKPGNVLIGDQEVKITDFGISRATGDSTATATGTVGTPAFFSPEVARGEDAGLPSDVFSLGATLYNAVEGGPPFGTADNHLAMLHRVAGGSIMPPANAGPLLSPVLFRLLATDPARRPSMQEAVHLLAAVVNETPPVSEATVIIPATVQLPVEAQPEEKAKQESAAAAAGLVAGAAAAEAAGLVSTPGPGAAAEAGAAGTAAEAGTASTAGAADSTDAAGAAAGAAEAAKGAGQGADAGNPSAGPAAEKAAAEKADAGEVAAESSAAKAVAGSAAAEKAAAERTAADKAAADKAAADRAAAERAAAERAAADKAAAERAAAAAAKASAATKVASPSVATPVTPVSTPPGPPTDQDGERRKFPLVPILIVLLVIAVGVGSFLLWPKGSGNNNAKSPESNGQTGSTTTGQTTGQTTEQSQPQQPGSSQTQPPPNTETQPPANTPSQPQAPAGPKNAQEAITAYYALIPGNLQEGYSLLTDRFKASKAGSYDAYQQWWSKFSSVQVSNPVPQGDNGITVTLTYFKGGAVDRVEPATFTFVQQNGKWLIDSQA